MYSGSFVRILPTGACEGTAATVGTASLDWARPRGTPKTVIIRAKQAEIILWVIVLFLGNYKYTPVEVKRDFILEGRTEETPATLEFHGHTESKNTSVQFPIHFQASTKCGV